MTKPVWLQTWEHRQQASVLRQWPALCSLADAVAEEEAFLGAILIGSFAAGRADPLSDIDVVVVTGERSFDVAWSRRGCLHPLPPLVVWDQGDGSGSAAAHKWITADLVLVECLIAAPDSGVQLAEPCTVLVGDPGLVGRFPRRPPIHGAEMADAAHPAERAYDAFKAALRKQFGETGEASS